MTPNREKDLPSRLRRLCQEVRAIASSGNPALRVRMTGQDELADLAGAINDMLATMENRSAQLESLRQFGLELAATSDLDALLRSIVSRAIRLLNAVDGGLYLYRPEHDDLVRVVSVGDTIAVGSILRRGEGLSGKVWETGAPLIVDSYHAWAGHAAIFSHEPDRAVVGVPITWGGEFLGVLNVAAIPPHTFTAADAELLGLFATQAAIAIRNARALAAAEQQRQRAEALARATAALTSTLELEALLENVLKAAIQAIPAAEKGTVLLQDKTGSLRIQAAVGYTDPRVRGLHLTGEHWYALQAAQQCRPLLIADARAEAYRYDGEIEEVRAIQSAIVAPLCCRERIIGVLSLDSASHEAAFTEEDLALLAVFADQAAMAVENARLFAAERRRSAELEVLRQASLRLTSRLELQPVMEAILEHALRLVAADDAHIFLYDGQTLTFGAALWANGRPGTPYGTPRPKGLTYTVARSGRRIVIPDVNEHPLYRDWQWSGAIVGLPLRVGERILGVMNVAISHPYAFDEDELRALELLADQAAIAIENARLYQDLQQQMDRLRQTQVQLVQSARMAAIGELDAGVGHELNNPLTSILGFAELTLEDLPDDSPYRHNLERIVGESRRVRDIIQRLLHFAGQTRLQKQPADINRLFQDTLALLREQMQSSGIVLHEEYAPDLPECMVDTGQIGQVFLNLLSNAMQAMPNSGTLTIRSFLAGNEVAVAISDTGPGMPPEVQEHLFEPFFSTKTKGTGLGLSVSLGLVQEHGGRITVESQVDQGSTFTVWLPKGEVYDGL